MLDSNIRNLTSLINYTSLNYDSDVFQLITISCDTVEQELDGLKEIAKKIEEEFSEDIRLFISYNPHELGGYYALEILELDFAIYPRTEGFALHIAEELGFEY